MVSFDERFVTRDEFSKRVLILPFPVRYHVNTGYLRFCMLNVELTLFDFFSYWLRI